MLIRLKAAARTFLSTLNPRTDLALENLALRQQLALLSHKATKRTRPKLMDRILWVLLSKIWPLLPCSAPVIPRNTICRMICVLWPVMRQVNHD